MRRAFIHLCLRLMTILGASWVLIHLYRRAVIEVPGPTSKDNHEPSILFLNPARYRGEVEAIAATGRFRVFIMPQFWMGRTFGNFYPRHRHSPLDFLLAEPFLEIARARRYHRALLKIFWPTLLRLYEIRLVIGAGYHYAQDRDYGTVAFESGIPFVLIHRETFKAAPAHREDVLSRTANFERFRGTKIIFHNRLLGELLMQSGFVSPGQVSILGSVRTDTLVSKLAEAPKLSSVCPTITLFSFFHRAGLNQSDPEFTDQFSGMWSIDGTAGFVNLFDDVHAAMAESANSQPDVKFIIKTKWGGRWHEEIFAAITKVNLDALNIPNLTITDEGDPADLIIASSAVISFQSTTLAESLLGNRRVIYPYFCEARHPEYQNWLLLHEEQDLFDVVTSKAELKQAISFAIANPEMEPSTLDRRRAVFEKYVSQANGKVLNNYIEEFNSLIGSKI